jgi:hypothetical protein
MSDCSSVIFYICQKARYQVSFENNKWWFLIKWGRARRGSNDGSDEIVATGVCVCVGG